MTRFSITVAAIVSVLFGIGHRQLAADEIDFNRDIRPVLSDRCFACHGPNEDSNDSGLRLDLEDTAKAELPSGEGFAIVAGDAANSEILHRIHSDDSSHIMPPADSGLTVSSEERALLKTWIELGAPYSLHWSFIEPAKTAPPEFRGGLLGTNEIDRFIIDRLTREGLQMALAADRYTLIRRLSLDLTGLPPSAGEVIAFARDRMPGAYERLVERLLASPHFGERMTLEWMDAARYADTNGYSIDGGRHMWLWRDWVIQAFNSNMPYDEFLLEQIAGDLLPNATPAQLIATGFQRNNMITHEGGTIPEENLTNYNVDRVRTLGESVLGLTLACAQCHDHKYDPITQKDYYSLFAYFNSLNENGLDGDGGVNASPYMTAKTVLQTGEETQLRTRIEQLKQQLATPDLAAFEDWQQQQLTQSASRAAGMNLLPIEVQKISTPNQGSGFVVEDHRFIHITEPAGLAGYDVLSTLPESDVPINGLRVVFHPDNKAPASGWGYGIPETGHDMQTAGSETAIPAKGNFVLTALSVSVGDVPSEQIDLFRLLKPASITANSWQSEYRPENCLDMRNGNGWSPQPSHQGPVHLTLTFDQPISAKATPFITTQLNFGAGKNMIAAKMELLAMTGVDDGSPLPPEIISILETIHSQRTARQEGTLRDYYTAHSRQTERLRIDLANAEERLRVRTDSFSTMVMNVAQQPRETFVLNRGDYSQPTTKVVMGTPDCLPKCDIEPNSRLALAKWITMPNHPLTARVYVNRVWQIMFGAGIVRTPADFGSQGEWPSHPELLDWLAVDFVESGWDVKALVKKIAMSQAYRQSSSTSADMIDRDPQNELLARGPRFRLPAEFVRDSALKVGGLLVPQLGGPSVNPYAPGDLWREISHYGSTSATAQTFVQDHGEKLYRRSLYTYWKRTSPPPNMATFDAPNRETCVVNRPATNTPMQALVVLNDVQFVEAARAFAQRIIAHDGDDRDKMDWAILESLSRPASGLELGVLQAALDRERKRYGADTQAANALLDVGESLRDENIPEPEHAAWIQVACTILNLSEFVTRN